MKHWWKPAGPAAFELGPWRVQKDWATGLWDVYRKADGVLVGSHMLLKAHGFDSAVEAMEEAEKLGA